MCLRGNKTKNYQAINVDRLLTETCSMEYFISKVDLSCLCASCAPFDSGFWDFERAVPWEPWIPPVIRIPEEINPPPRGNAGGVVIVGSKLLAKFQRIVAYAMMNGKTFDEAVEEAINS